MTNKPIWMVRAASGGVLADEFVEHGLVAVGWEDVGNLKELGGKEAILAAVSQCWPEWPKGRKQSSASQLIRFRDELKQGDRVVTYDSSRRVYHLGTLTSDYQHVPNTPVPFENVRFVKWEAEIERDSLSLASRNSLGSVLTLFRLPEFAAKEVLGIAEGEPSASSAEGEGDEAEDELALLEQYRQAALEFVKDRISRLDERDMEELAAGLLRAMGYKTQLSEAGADRGVDVLASPDGFGFESPRILVEVKHPPNRPWDHRRSVPFWAVDTPRTRACT